MPITLGSWLLNPPEAWTSAFILCLCYPVYVAALRRADHPSKASYRQPIKIHNFRILNQNRPKSLIRQCIIIIIIIIITLSLFVVGNVSLWFAPVSSTLTGVRALIYILRIQFTVMLAGLVFALINFSCATSVYVDNRNVSSAI
jgi:hypothetical protein